MNKMMKKVISLILTTALVVGGITYTKSVEAATDTNDWTANAITVPAEGQLVGAGYIDVEFDNSMEGYTYTVYLDGEPMYWIGDDIVRTEIGEVVTDEAVIKTFTSEEEGKTEVYTNTVSSHEIKVVATNGEETHTATNTFYVSKKGLAMGGDMSETVEMSKLNLSWYYNWATTAFNSTVDAGVMHVPMMWGAAEDNIADMANVTEDSNYILGYNEPDIGSQANISPLEGIQAWTHVEILEKRTVSPASANPNGPSSWLTSFMTGVTDENGVFVAGVDCDAVAVHSYGANTNITRLLQCVDSVWEEYKKPIWVTEVSVMGRKGTSYDNSYENIEAREAVEEYVKQIVEELDKRPYVERYAWFPYNIQSENEIDDMDGSGASAMFDYESGKFTELGRIYSEMGNPEGYVGSTISEDEMYVEQTTEETTTPEVTAEETTTKEITTASPTTKTDVSVPAQVVVKKAKNIKKKSVKLKWSKVDKAEKYQIQYSLNKKFKKAKKYKTTIKTTSSLTITIKKLKKKKYYFRVRAVNSVGIGKWSKPKKVKINK